MSDQKISQLTGGGAAQATDEYVIARSGANYKITGANVAAAATSVGTLSSLTVSGDLTVDTSTLYVKSSTNEVGIGTTSPEAKLHVTGDIISDAGTGNGRILLQSTGTENSIFSNATGFGEYRTLRLRGLTNEFYTGAVGSPNSLKMSLDASGNLGLGVTPSAWSAGKAIERGFAGTADWGFSQASSYRTTNAYFNSGWKYGGTGAACNYAQEAGAHTWSSAASGTAGNAITFTDLMKLDASGNLGVGTASPTTFSLAGKHVEVDGSNGNYSFIHNRTTNVRAFFAVDDVDDIVSLFSYTNHPLKFGTNNTERARITSGGEFLVAKATSDATVVGCELRPGGGINSTRSGSTNATSTMEVYSTGAGAYRFYVAMDGTVSATNTTISAISDARLKENIRDLDVGLDAILALKPRTFDWKEGKGKDIKNDRGFIAQEFEEVFPDLIDEWKDPAPEGEEPYRSVRQDLIPVLVKAIQELDAKNKALEARLEALEA